MTELEYQKLRLVLDQFSFYVDAANPKQTKLIGHRKSAELESRIKRLEEQLAAERPEAR